MAKLMDRIYHRIRHRDAQLIADAATEDTDLATLAEHDYCLVATYKQDGTAVPTPVWFAIGDGQLYFRTAADAPKIKRIRATPTVRLAACDARGRPLHKPLKAISGVARILDADETATAEASLGAKYGRKRAMYTAAFGGASAYVAVCPVQPPA
ncbi:MAG TPA: PPOX class F420-dependent oxidoreductase [Solirubrobacteraceae bacterium]|nr:PPOX class F420-dependent oxidoreductase [Solirubrobacteraceae bacterium]